MKDSDLRLEIMRQRINHGMTQIDLAKRIGLSQRSVSMWENGESVPRNTARLKLSEAFGLPSNYFFSDDCIDEKIVTNQQITDSQEDLEKTINKLLTQCCNDTDTLIAKIVEYSEKKQINKG